ncbi:MAG: DNA (cytosine-5-)-methyltransferase, partial [Candidatus Aquilonibacter sp.]
MRADRYSDPAAPGAGTTVACLFSAIGGFAHAFRSLGAEVLWANENDSFATKTFAKNLPDIKLIERDVRMLSVFRDRLQPVDILTAGFPCQPFSIAGEKRGLGDERGVLFLEIIRLIGEFGKNRPRVLFLENVKHLRAHDKGRTFQRIQSEIQRAGYWFGPTNTLCMNTLDYSTIPQNRERLFMVALDAEAFPTGGFSFPTPNKPRRLDSVWEYLDLSQKAHDRYYIAPGSRYYKHYADAVEEGGVAAVYQLRRNYVRKNMTGTCFTLMANMGDGGHNQPVIQDRWGIRKLTPRECARLQGYGDWLEFPEELSDTQRYKQIGNSVTLPVVSLIDRGVVKLFAARKQERAS